MNSQSLSARLPEAAGEWGCTGLGIVSKVPRNKWCSLSLPSRLSEPFQSAHNKCARHRMHHLPPQIRALMGRQIAVRGGHAGRPVPAPPACLPACLPGAPACAPPGVPSMFGWTFARASGWALTRKGIGVHAGMSKKWTTRKCRCASPTHMRGGRVCPECLGMAQPRLFEGAQRKGCCT